MLTAQQHVHQARRRAAAALEPVVDMAKRRARDASPRTRVIVGCLLLFFLYQTLFASSSAAAAASKSASPRSAVEPTDGLAVDDGNAVDGTSNYHSVEAQHGGASVNQDPEIPSEATTVEQDVPAATSDSVITIITGTHATKAAMLVDERKQPALCGKLADVLHMMFASWEVKPYASYKSQVRSVLKQIRQAKVSCTLAGSRKYNMLWTFPLSWRQDAECDARAKGILEKKTWLRDQTLVYVNWFLLRPDLVTFNNMALVEGVEPRFVVIVGHDIISAAFAKEGCPRLNTILDKRDVYKQRLLLLTLSDVEYQLSRMRGNAARIYACTRSALPATLKGQPASHVIEWLPLAKQGELVCDARPGLYAPQSKTHMGSMSMMRLFGGVEQVLPKTVFTGPRLVFVAGLEGVGHHVFSLLGRKHTTRALYDALSDHLCDAAWDDASEQKYGPARERLVQSMRAIREDVSALPKDGSGVFFLNTVWVQRDVNMYSFPWGGPRCFLKRYARGMCNIDIIELARMAEEAKVDFRIIFLKRAIGAAVVSASLHRPFGTLVSETRMLAQSWALLKSGLATLDPRFTIEVGYEDLLNHPEESTAKLAEHLGFGKDNALYEQFVTSLKESALEHPVGDGSKWKEEVDALQLGFMTDLLPSSN